MADKNVVKGRRCKGGHWLHQFGYEDPALVGADGRVVEGSPAIGGHNEPLEPLLNKQPQPTENPAALVVLELEVPSVAVCEKIQPMVLSGSINSPKALVVQSGQSKATKSKDITVNPYGWEESLAARVTNLSIGTIDEYFEAVTPSGSYDEGKSPFPECYTAPGAAQPKAGTSPWQHIEPLDSSKIQNLSVGSRSKADKGLQATVPGPVGLANSQVRSDPIAISQTNVSKNKMKRKLRKNTKGKPMVLTSLLPEPRKYSIKPPDEMSKSQNGQEEFVVWVNNLSDCTSREDLEALFKPFGPIVKLHLAEDRETGCYAFGYVHYESKEDAAKAIAELDGKAFDNAVLNVVWSNPTVKI